MAGGGGSRRSRDGADEGNADLAAQGGDGRPVEAAPGVTRDPVDPSARGRGGASERDGPERGGTCGGLAGFRLPLVRVAVPREEPGDQRSSEAASQGGVRGRSTGGDLPRGHPVEPRHHARTARRHGLADRDGLQRGRERNRAEEGARADQETRLAGAGARGARRRDRIEGRGPRDLPEAERPSECRTPIPRSGCRRRPAHALRRTRLLGRPNQRSVGEIRKRAIGTKTTVSRLLVGALRESSRKGYNRTSICPDRKSVV